MSLRIMIVDDDPIVSSTIAAVLESRGYRVEVRNQAIGTRAAILEFQPDVVVLDVEMPGMSGTSLLGLIGRANAEPLAVIFHSSISPSALLELEHKPGVIGVIPKGDIRKFLPAFDQIINKKNRKQRIDG